MVPRQGNALGTRESAAADVFGSVVRAAAIAELHILHVIVRTVLVHVVQVRGAAVGAFERRVAGLKSVQLRSQLAVGVAIPRHKIGEVDAL
ncbi:hypothetical protein D3C72_2280490 [compost metagenome]